MVSSRQMERANKREHLIFILYKEQRTPDDRPQQTEIFQRGLQKSNIGHIRSSCRCVKLQNVHQLDSPNMEGLATWFSQTKRRTIPQTPRFDMVCPRCAIFFQNLILVQKKST